MLSVPHSFVIIGVPNAGADEIKDKERKINKKMKKFIIKVYVLFNNLDVLYNELNCIAIFTIKNIYNLQIYIFLFYSFHYFIYSILIV